MAEFIYEGTTSKGSKKKGEVVADSKAEAEARLKASGITPKKLRKKGIFDKDLDISFGGVPEKDLVIFTRQFATMIDSGLPLVQCLEILSSQAQHPGFRKELKAIKEAVESGSTFADALKKFPDTFDTLYVNLVAAGEVGGILDTILGRLAAYIEKNSKLKAQVKSAMAYPAGVMSVAVLVVSGLLVYVVPVFEDMFADMGSALPAPTQFVVDLSEWLQANIGYCIAGIIVTIFALGRIYKTEKGRFVMDSILLQLPVIGDVIRKVAVARFCRTLSTMISSGVPIMDALDICSRTAGNVVIERAVQSTRESISEGRTISEPLMESKVFPDMVVQMISVGESTGALDTMLSKIADFYDDEVDSAVGTLTSLIEPFMMVFLGGAIGGLVIAMYMPIFSMASNVGG